MPLSACRLKLAQFLRLSSLILVAALCALAASDSRAHEIRPAIADINLTTDRAEIEIRLSLEPIIAGIDLSEVQDTNASPLADRYDALRAENPEALADDFRGLWPTIAEDIRLFAGDGRVAMTLQDVTVIPEPDLELPRDARVVLAASLPEDGSPVTLGWDAAFGPLVVRQGAEEEDGYSGYLTEGADSEPMPRTGSAQQSWLSAFVDYVRIGFEHIVPKGLDHILFVLGLFFFSLQMRPLLYQVTAFTLAHTVTLAIATLGLLQIPASIVEPLIAASIVYVAVENIFLQRYRPWRTVVVFGFGLLHGLGFASVLGDIGLNPARFVTGLIGFNIGVELGQLAVIAAAFLTIGLWFGRKSWYRSAISVPASTAIAIVGAYWFVERVFL